MSACPECGRSDTQLLSISGVARELGLTRHAAEKIFRSLPKVHHPGGLRRDYVYRRELERYLADRTEAA